MPNYKVRFSVEYRLLAEDEKDALETATDVFIHEVKECGFTKVLSASVDEE